MLQDGELLQHDESSGRYFKEIFERQRFTIKSEPSGVHRSEAGTRSDRELNINMMRHKIDEWQKEIDKFTDSLNFLKNNADTKPASIEISKVEAERMISIRQRQKNSYLVEIHKKYALSAAWLIFVLIGAPLGIRIRRGSIGVSVGVSLGFFLLYWACLLGGEELADRNLFNPVWAMWTANIVIGIPGVILVWVTGKEKIW